jgi:hypothetical protein
LFPRVNKFFYVQKSTRKFTIVAFSNMLKDALSNPPRPRYRIC